MIVWFFTAAMIESFNVWRWNYGPYKKNPNQINNGMGTIINFDQFCNAF